MKKFFILGILAVLAVFNKGFGQTIQINNSSIDENWTGQVGQLSMSNGALAIFSETSSDWSVSTSSGKSYLNLNKALNFETMSVVNVSVTATTAGGIITNTLWFSVTNKTDAVCGEEIVFTPLFEGSKFDVTVGETSVLKVLVENQGSQTWCGTTAIIGFDTYVLTDGFTCINGGDEDTIHIAITPQATDAGNAITVKMDGKMTGCPTNYVDQTSIYCTIHNYTAIAANTDWSTTMCSEMEGFFMLYANDLPMTLASIFQDPSQGSEWDEFQVTSIEEVVPQKQWKVHYKFNPYEIATFHPKMFVFWDKTAMEVELNIDVNAPLGTDHITIWAVTESVMTNEGETFEITYAISNEACVDQIIEPTMASINTDILNLGPIVATAMDTTYVTLEYTGMCYPEEIYIFTYFDINGLLFNSNSIPLQTNLLSNPDVVGVLMGLNKELDEFVVGDTLIANVRLYNNGERKIIDLAIGTDNFGGFIIDEIAGNDSLDIEVAFPLQQFVGDSPAVVLSDYVWIGYGKYRDCGGSLRSISIDQTIPIGCTPKSFGPNNFIITASELEQCSPFTVTIDSAYQRHVVIKEVKVEGYPQDLNFPITADGIVSWAHDVQVDVIWYYTFNPKIFLVEKVFEATTTPTVSITSSTTQILLEEYEEMPDNYPVPVEITVDYDQSNYTLSSIMFGGIHTWGNLNSHDEILHLTVPKYKLVNNMWSEATIIAAFQTCDGSYVYSTYESVSVDGGHLCEFGYMTRTISSCASNVNNFTVTATDLDMTLQSVTAVGEQSAWDNFEIVEIEEVVANESWKVWYSFDATTSGVYYPEMEIQFAEKTYTKTLTVNVNTSNVPLQVEFLSDGVVILTEDEILTRSYTMKNPSCNTMTLYEVVLGGSYSSYLQVLDWEPIIIAPGDSASFDVNFSFTPFPCTMTPELSIKFRYDNWEYTLYELVLLQIENTPAPTMEITNIKVLNAQFVGDTATIQITVTPTGDIKETKLQLRHIPAGQQAMYKDTTLYNFSEPIVFEWKLKLIDQEPNLALKVFYMKYVDCTWNTIFDPTQTYPYFTIIDMPSLEIPTSYHEVIDNGEFSVFPNPTTDILHFSQELEYKLVDIYGKTVGKGNEKFIDMTTLPSGLYLLHTERGTHKVIKK